jgi:NHLM bacteriocin system ABC transporter peptidase/ATP-binding protein
MILSKHKSNKRFKTPCVLQINSSESGAAALGSILSFYKRFVPLYELREKCGVSRDGTKPSGIIASARYYGMEANGYRKSTDELRKLNRPTILFWNSNHYVVLEGFNKSTAYINDPAMGRWPIPIEEFEEAYTGIVLDILPGTDFKPSGEPVKLLPLIKKYSTSIMKDRSFVIILGILTVLLSLIIPVFSKVFIDDILVKKQTDWLTALIISMTATVFLVLVVNYLQYSVLRRVKLKLTITLGYNYFKKALRMPMAYYSNRSKSGIASRFDSCRTAAEYLSGALVKLLFSAISVLLFAALMIIYSPYLTLVVVFLSILNPILIRVFRDRNDNLSRLFTNDYYKLIGQSMNGLFMIETLKSSSRENDFFENWSGLEAKVINREQELGKVNAKITSASVLLTSLNLSLILVLGGRIVIDGELTMGALVAFATFTVLFTSNIGSFLSHLVKLQYLKALLVQLEDLIDHPLAHDWTDRQEHTSGDRDVKHLVGHIELKNVSFGYTKNTPPIIEDFNLTVASGKSVAIVGSSGSGKSTIAKVIAGLYEPWEGEILFDGKPNTSWPRHVLKHSISMVDQEIFLFEGSVHDVLTMWDEDIHESELIRACKDAQIHDEISKRPQGYESIIEENGSNFSGGQRQRLEIARSLIHDPSILIMDEATSSLDTIAENKTMNSILDRGCTSIIVAHRLSTVKDCDEILVMKEGQIVERGTHEQLMAKKAWYVELLNNS